MPQVGGGQRVFELQPQEIPNLLELLNHNTEVDIDLLMVSDSSFEEV